MTVRPEASWQSPEAKIEDQQPWHGNPQYLVAAQFQVGGKEIAQMRGGSTPNRQLPGELYPMQQFHDLPVRTQDEMITVRRDSEEATRLFPGPNDQKLRDAAYRYLMNKECVDDYSVNSKRDQQILEKAAPGTIEKLDQFIEEQRKLGPIPGSKCAPLVS